MRQLHVPQPHLDSGRESGTLSRRQRRTYGRRSFRLMAKSARMSDVAKLAGVSTMTVSRVLNDSAGVTDGLRKKVFVAIEKLRYQPNELARSLREQRTRQIGIIVPYLFDPFFATCAHVISTVAKQHSYSV